MENLVAIRDKVASSYSQFKSSFPIIIYQEDENVQTEQDVGITLSSPINKNGLSTQPISLFYQTLLKLPESKSCKINFNSNKNSSPNRELPYITITKPELNYVVDKDMLVYLLPTPEAKAVLKDLDFRSWFLRLKQTIGLAIEMVTLENYEYFKKVVQPKLDTDKFTSTLTFYLNKGSKTYDLDYVTLQVDRVLTDLNEYLLFKNSDKEEGRSWTFSEDGSLSIFDILVFSYVYPIMTLPNFINLKDCLKIFPKLREQSEFVLKSLHKP